MNIGIKGLLAATIAGTAITFAGCVGVQQINYENADKYSVVSGTSAASSDITELNINWISGKVKVEYADVDRITYSESIDEGESDTKKMYSYEHDGKLFIQYGKVGIWNFNINKELVVQLPREYQLKNIDIDVISANIEMPGIKSTELNVNTISGDLTMTDAGNFNKVDIDTVSGNTVFIGKVDSEINADTVSGDADYRLDTSGYTLTFDTVSGDYTSDFETRVNDKTYTYGDGHTRIVANSVSGNIRVNKI